MEEEPSAGPGREIDEDAIASHAPKRPRLFQQGDDLNPSPSPSYATPAAHTAGPVASSVLNTRAILSVLKGIGRLHQGCLFYRGSNWIPSHQTWLLCLNSCWYNHTCPWSFIGCCLSSHGCCLCCSFRGADSPQLCSGSSNLGVLLRQWVCASTAFPHPTAETLLALAFCLA